MLAAVAALLFAAGCGGSRTDQYRQEGDTYLRLEKFDQARASYERALEAQPDNALAALGLGRTLIALDQFDDAVAAFDMAIEADADFTIAYLEKANLLMAQNRPDDAMATAAALKATAPELGGVLEGNLLLRQGHVEEAVESLETVAGAMPNSALAQRHLATALLANGEPDQAEAALNNANDAADASEPGTALLMLEAMHAQGRIDDEIAKLEQTQAGAENPARKMVLAHALILGGREEEAQSLLQPEVADKAASAWRDLVIGSYVFANGAVDEAAPRLRDASRALPWEPIVMRNTAALTAPQAGASKRPPKPRAAAEDAPEQEAPADAQPARREEWRALWQQAALSQLLTEHDPTPDAPALHETLTVAAFVLGDAQRARSLADGLPADSPIKQFADKLQENETQQALDALNPLSDGNADEQILGMNALGAALGASGARAQAVQVLSKCAGLFPGHGASLLNIALIFNRADRPRFAGQALRKLIALFPQNIEAHALLFRVLRDAGLQSDARQTAEAMYALFPDAREAAMAVAMAYVDAGQLEQARTAIEAHLQRSPDDDAARFLQASIYFREGEPDASLRILEDLALRGELPTGVTTLSALCHAAEQDWDAVIDLVAGKNPERWTPAARLMLVAAYLETGKPDDAAAALQPGGDTIAGGHAGVILANALGLDAPDLPDGDAALVEALAADTAARADFAAAAAYNEAKTYEAAFRALDGVDRAVDAPADFAAEQALHALGRAAGIADIPSVARAIAERHPDSASVWLAFAALMRDSDNTEAEREALDRALETAPNDPRVRLRRAAFLKRQDDAEAALAEYRAVLQTDPNHPIANNNLAYQLLTSDGDAAEALAAAERAAAAMPNDPSVQHTLGVAQLRAGDLEASAKSLTAALQSRPGDPELLLDYGRLLIARGDTESGRAHLRTALDSARLLGLTFEREAEAEQLLAETD